MNGNASTPAGAIDLTPEERALIAEMTFEPGKVAVNEPWLKNGDLVMKLWDLLRARRAFPEHRVRYFIDPDYNIGGHGKSRQQIYQKNNCTDEDILRSASFLPHLRYMIFGPDLPTAVIDEYARAVAACGNITSGDVLPLADTAKRLARAHGLGGRASEAFFQLALDLGLDVGDARYTRDAVAKLP